MVAEEAGLRRGFSVEWGYCHQPWSRLPGVPNVSSLGSKKANDCQPILDPQDLPVVVGKGAPHRRSDPGTESDLRGSTTAGREPESESATDYELCWELQQAFL